MRGTYAGVSLENYRRNIGAVRSLIGGSVRLMAVVKADAYGHGLIRIAGAAQEARADWLGVALAEEGIALREAGITLPILVFTGLRAQDTLDAVRHGLTLTVFTPEHLAFARAAAEQSGRAAEVHIKLDTGMNRIGVREEGDLRALLEETSLHPGLRLTGAFTHFACADDPDPAFTDRQLARFHRMAKALPEGILLHTAGSSALLTRPDTRFHMVRAGLALYGYSPVATPLPLEPVLSWKAEISHVKAIQAGESVSYGATFTARETTRVASLSVGYGDGFSRLLSNRGTVLISGRRCRVLGRVCMDQIMADVTGIPDVRPGDEAVLIGRQGGEMITAEDIARETGTIPYEVLLNISKRVPRRYEST